MPAVVVTVVVVGAVLAAYVCGAGVRPRRAAAGEPVPPPAQARAQNAQADRDDQQPGGEVEPG